MLRVLRQRAGILRHVVLTLALLALSVKVLVPQGFMVAPQPSADAPFALVICTGHGTLVVDPAGAAKPGSEHRDPSGKSPTHDAPCAFSGHGAAAPPPSLAPVATVEFVSHVFAPAQRVADLAPGRGLAAPPLPARGPPSRLI